MYMRKKASFQVSLYPSSSVWKFLNWKGRRSERFLSSDRIADQLDVASQLASSYNFDDVVQKVTQVSASSTTNRRRLAGGARLGAPHDRYPVIEGNNSLSHWSRNAESRMSSGSRSTTSKLVQLNASLIEIEFSHSVFDIDNSRISSPVNLRSKSITRLRDKIHPLICEERTNQKDEICPGKGKARKE